MADSCCSSSGSEGGNSGSEVVVAVGVEINC